MHLPPSRTRWWKRKFLHNRLLPLCTASLNRRPPKHYFQLWIPVRHLPSSDEHADCELAYILSRFTFKVLILVTQDGLRRRLLHCQAQSKDNEDSVAERALYQRHVCQKYERSRKARPQHGVIMVFSQIGLFLDVLITTGRNDSSILLYESRAIAVGPGR